MHVFLYISVLVFYINNIIILTNINIIIKNIILDNEPTTEITQMLIYLFPAALYFNTTSI